MAANFIELVRLQATDDANTFISCAKPEKMGNPADIAYGGCVLALAVHAAFTTVQATKPNFEVYSVLGSYLGPTLADRTVTLRVSTLRETRSFATRFVVATQKYDDGSQRSTFSATVDFIAPNAINTEQAGVPYTRYSRKPKATYASPEQLPSMWEILDKKVAEGRLAQRESDFLRNVIFALNEKTIVGAQPPQSLHAENAMGADAKADSAQYKKALTDRMCVDYLKSRHLLGALSQPPPGSPPRALEVTPAAANAAFGAFVMDAALSFIPLTMSGMNLNQAGAVSSLDCALRFHSKLDLDQFHLREMQTIAGNDCRTYSEAMLWDKDKNLVATMNQSCILRPKPQQSSKL